MKNLIGKHPIIAYFTIAFGWTWIIVLALILSGQAKDVGNPTMLFIIGGIISGISPTMGAFLVSGATGGKEGVRKLTGRFKKKNAAGLYALAGLAVPLITALTAIISNYTVRSYKFSLVAPMIAMGLVWPLFSGFGEEFGWRGFILPKLLEKHSPLKAALILGVIWEAWHIPMHYIAYQDYGMYMIPAFLTIGFINLTLQTVIMTWIFTISKGGLKLMILYHYTITASSILLGALFTTESAPRLVFNESIISITLFAVFALILYARGRSKSIDLREGK